MRIRQYKGDIHGRDQDGACVGKSMGKMGERRSVVDSLLSPLGAGGSRRSEGRWMEMGITEGGKWGRY